MSKAFQGFLLCSVLSLPFLGSSNAHAALIINNALSKCLDVKFNNTANGTPLRSVLCSATFGDQWRWNRPCNKGDRNVHRGRQVCRRCRRWNGGWNACPTVRLQRDRRTAVDFL